MGQLIAVVILLLLAVAARVILGRVATSLAENPRTASSARGTLAAGKFVGAGFALIAALVFVLSVFVVVAAGHVGVVVVFGQVREGALREGLNVVPPWWTVVQMSLQVQRRGDKFSAASKDLQAVHVDMILNFQLDPSRAPEVFRAVGLDYANVIIVPAEQEVLKAHTALYVASEILQLRHKLKAEVQSDMGDWLKRYGIVLREASLANIRFDPAYEKAIEAKQIQEQLAEQKRYELIQAQRQAEIVAAQAKGDANRAREAALGEADALRSKGQAQAEYNAKVSASLTPALVQLQWIEQWGKGGAKVPDVYSSGAGGEGFLFQLPRAPQGKKAD